MTTFAKSSVSPGIPINQGVCQCIFTNGTSAIAGFSGDLGVWYSPDSINFNLTNVNIGSFLSVSVNETNAVICSSNNKGIYYSSNTGVSWTQSNISTGNFNNIFLQSTNAVACSNSTLGLWYSSDSGITWTQSDITTGNFSSVHGTGGTTFIAGSTSVAGLYHSTNGGITWSSISNVSALTFRYVYMQGTNAIALESATILNGSALGIWYSTDTGVTWTKTTTTNTVSTGLLLTSCEISSFTGTIIVCSNSGNWRSTNSGSTWTRVVNVSQNQVTTNKTIANYWYSVDTGSNRMYYSLNDGVSWGSSNNPRYRTISASGTKVLIGSSNNIGISYSTNNGATFSYALKDTSNISTAQVCINGSNIFAVCNEGGYIYSSNGGINYTYSSGPSGIFFTNCANVGSNIIASAATRLYYSTNNGVTLTQATATNLAGTPNVIGFFGTIALVGSSSTGTTGLWRSTDSGVNWTKMSFPNIQIKDMKINGSTAIACCSFSNGLYYSIDSGITWTQNIAYAQYEFYSCQILTPTSIVASYDTFPGVVYSTNSGETLNPSSGVSGNYLVIGYSGTNVILSSRSGATGYYYSNDSGVTWTQSNITNVNGNIGCVNGELSFIGTNSIASALQNNVYYSIDSGATYNTTNLPVGYYKGIVWAPDTQIAAALGVNLIYYSTPIACFNENTTLLTSSGNYVLISKLKVGDELITYKDGNKKIKFIKNFKLNQNLNDPLNCMYKMKNSDFIISGGHSILVDSLTEQQSLTQKNKFKGFDEKIYDKQLLLACVSEDFELVNSNKTFNLYHIVLENVDINVHYGIYANNGILTETVREKYYNDYIKNIA